MTKIVIKGHENLSKNDFSHLFDMADWGGFVSYVAGVTEWDIFLFFGEDDDGENTNSRHFRLRRPAPFTLSTPTPVALR